MNKKEFIRENCPDRHGTNCSKWDILPTKYGDPDLISMWVADMDFKAPREVTEALRKKVDFGIYGYSLTPDSYYQSFIKWEKEQHGWEVRRDWIRFAPGVVTGIFWCMHMLTKPGDAAIINMPVYYPFHHAIEDIDRKLIYSELVNTGGTYTIDFGDFEKKIIDNDVKVFILCSPHNPLGIVWTREELERMCHICIANNVLIVSDEIHSDLVFHGKKHIPTATLSPEIAAHVISCISGTKTFNLAGLQASATIFPNQELKARFDKFWFNLDIHRNNAFSTIAMEVAFNEGEEWLEQLLGYIGGNFEFIKDYCAANIPQVKPNVPDATYLVWLDCRGLGMGNEELRDFMIRKAGLGLNEGWSFGRSLSGFMRLNAACPRPVLEKAMEQLKHAVDARNA